eukprot:1240099-Lingulodinium_polyedra.AAC.1
MYGKKRPNISQTPRAIFGRLLLPDAQPIGNIGEQAPQWRGQERFANCWLLLFAGVPTPSNKP